MHALRARTVPTAGSREIRCWAEFNPVFAVSSEDSSESRGCKNPHFLLFILYNSVIRRNPHVGRPRVLNLVPQVAGHGEQRVLGVFGRGPNVRSSALIIRDSLLH